MAAGRPKTFETPKSLEQAWGEYKLFLKEEAKNWPKVQYVGKEGDRKEDYPVLPYTIEGFKRYCRSKYGCVDQYLKNQDNDYIEFLPICSYIKEEVREHQITGGLLGTFNASITQRLNGLTEKQETVIKTTENPFKWEELEGNKED